MLAVLVGKELWGSEWKLGKFWCCREHSDEVGIHGTARGSRGQLLEQLCLLLQSPKGKLSAPRQSDSPAAALRGSAEDAALSCPLPLHRSSLRTSGSSWSTCSSSSWKLSSGEAGAAAWGSRSTTAGRGRRSWSKRSSSSSRCGQLGREGSASAAWCARGDDSSSTERGVPGSSLAGCSPLRSWLWVQHPAASCPALGQERWDPSSEGHPVYARTPLRCVPWVCSGHFMFPKVLQALLSQSQETVCCSWCSGSCWLRGQPLPSPDVWWGSNGSVLGHHTASDSCSAISDIISDT